MVDGAIAVKTRPARGWATKHLGAPMNKSSHAHSSRRQFVQGVLLAGSASLFGQQTAPAAAIPTAAEEKISPVEDLMREHGVLNRVLVVYDEAIRRLESGEELSPDPVRNAAKIVREYVEDYHEKLEQDYLFPRFLNANCLPDLVQVLLEQHLGGRNLTDEALHLATLQTMKNADDRRRLATSLRRFTRMYHAHESREDTVLFPIFRSLISAHEYAALREDFDKRERELFGTESFPRMAERVAAIERQLGIAELARYTEGF